MDSGGSNKNASLYALIKVNEGGQEQKRLSAPRGVGDSTYEVWVLRRT